MVRKIAPSGTPVGMEQGKPAISFQTAAEQFIATHKDGWSERYTYEWNIALKKHAYPVIGNRPLSAIDTRLVLKVLEPIWTKRPVTAIHLRYKLENILNWGKAFGFYSGENPARWQGHLKSILANTTRNRKIKHRAALHYSKIARLIVRLRWRMHRADRALELLVLTAARVREVLNAKWSEFDLEKKIWVIPAGRMKARREYRIPLSNQAVALLRIMERYATSSGYVFPGFQKGKPLSQFGVLLRFRRIGYTDFSLYGLRSTFRDWAAERTDFPAELIGYALAHRIASGSEVAYLRTDMFEKRAKLMQAWADFCDRHNRDLSAELAEEAIEGNETSRPTEVRPPEGSHGEIRSQITGLHTAVLESLQRADANDDCEACLTLLNEADRWGRAYAALLEAHIISLRTRTTLKDLPPAV